MKIGIVLTFLIASALQGNAKQRVDTLELKIGAVHRKFVARYENSKLYSNCFITEITLEEEQWVMQYQRSNYQWLALLLINQKSDLNMSDILEILGQNFRQDKSPEFSYLLNHYLREKVDLKSGISFEIPEYKQEQEQQIVNEIIEVGSDTVKRLLPLLLNDTESLPENLTPYLIFFKKELLAHTTWNTIDKKWIHNGFVLYQIKGNAKIPVFIPDAQAGYDRTLRQAPIHEVILAGKRIIILQNHEGRNVKSLWVYDFLNRTLHFKEIIELNEQSDIKIKGSKFIFENIQGKKKKLILK